MQSEPETATQKHVSKKIEGLCKTNEEIIYNQCREWIPFSNKHPLLQRKKISLFITAWAVRSISINQYLSHYCNSLYVSFSQSSVSQNAAAWLLNGVVPPYLSELLHFQPPFPLLRAPPGCAKGAGLLLYSSSQIHFHFTLDRPLHFQFFKLVTN